MKTLLRYLPLVLLAVAWEAVSRLGLVSSSALPPLSEVMRCFLKGDTKSMRNIARAAA